MSTAARIWCRNRSARRFPVGIAPDEAEHPVLYVGVVGDRHPWTVLAGGADHVLQRLHGGEHRLAELWVKAVVLTGRPGQVPGVHEDIVGVELVDRPVDREPT